MVISISDQGIFRTDTSSYPMTNTSSVSSISSVKAISDNESSIVRDAEKSYVSENTPAYNVTISSMGKAAIQSMKALGESSASASFVSSSASDPDSSAVSVNAADDTSSASFVNIFADDDDNDTVDSVSQSSETTSSSVNTNNLAIYTEAQLKDMVSEGTITRSEMNSEIEKRSSSSEESAADMDPVIRQAIAAYNFQMSYQINSTMMQ